ncbi:hypothetical protein C8R44DRAFT_974056 [Mycena epipterygia]|nr:hypothetical protein C8R44DRAFT_974056 [Mycena epipterygia]
MDVGGPRHAFVRNRHALAPPSTSQRRPLEPLTLTPSLRAPPQHPQYASCDMPRGHGCMYAPPLPHACYDDRYEHHRHPHSPRPTRMTLRAQNGGQIVHTDDAATKLSDRLRCFNCCTTDTSAWRCYNLSPALQQMRPLRAHAHAPAPEQFPHKRSSLASSTLCSRSPPHNKHRAQDEPLLCPSLRRRTSTTRACRICRSQVWGSNTSSFFVPYLYYFTFNS